MELLVCVVLILAVNILEIQSQQAWLVPCVNNTDCETLKNATCINGICTCGEFVYACEEKEIIKTNIIGGQCDNSRICNAMNSQCLNNICVCNEGFTASSDSKQCLKVLGGECFNNQDCSFTNNTNCINSKCSCLPGYISLNNAECLSIARNLGDQCKTDNQCQMIFGNDSVCLENHCRCKYDYHFKETTKKCVRDLFLGDICAKSEDCHQPGFESKSRLICLEGECQCNFNYKEEKGYCMDKNGGNVLLKSLKLQFLITTIVLTIYLFN